MNLRQQYIKERNSKQHSWQWLFQFYKEKGGLLNTMEEFSNIFNAIGGITQDVLNHIDSHFKLVTLHEKSEKGMGAFIKVVE